jgi:hypothetical protein
MSNPFRYLNSSPEVIRLVVTMYVRYALSLRNVSAEGVNHVETALPLSPHDFAAREWQSYRCYLKAHLAQWEQAIEACEKAAAAKPEFGRGDVLGKLAAAYAWAGRDKEAKEAIAQLRKVDFPRVIAKRVTVHR